MRTTTPKLATFVRNVALFVAAPVVALAYVFVGPFVGLGVLAWMATRAATGYNAAA
jgi:hypothetical protein